MNLHKPFSASVLNQDLWCSFVINYHVFTCTDKCNPITWQQCDRTEPENNCWTQETLFHPNIQQHIGRRLTETASRSVFVNVWAVEHGQFSRPGWSVAVLQCVWEDALRVVRRCALTRGDPRGSRTQSFGLVRHPPPERQRFTRPFIQPVRLNRVRAVWEGTQRPQGPKVYDPLETSSWKFTSLLKQNFKNVDTVDVFRGKKCGYLLIQGANCSP